MPNPSTSELPRPKSWDEFEDIVAGIYKRFWEDEHTTRNGRSGQRQHGVDIYGRPYNYGGMYVGVQCKRLDEGKLTKKRIETEIEKADNFRPPLVDRTFA